MDRKDTKYTSQIRPATVKDGIEGTRSAMPKLPPDVAKSKPGGRRPHKPPAAIQAEFVTPSQALEYLAGPKGPPLRQYATGRRHETLWDMAQACLIKAHIEGRINLVGRKGDVSDLDAKSDSFERIPNEYFEHDVVLGETLVAPPRRPGQLADAEFWRDVKMPRTEFEAAFKSSSSEAALLRWWKAKTRYDGKPPTEWDAYVLFAQRQRPKLPRRWLTDELKKLPKDLRRKGSGRPPDSVRKAKAAAEADAKSANAKLKLSSSSGSKTQPPVKTRARTRPKRIAKDGPTKGLRPDYHQIIRQEQTEKTAACWKVNLKRRGKYMHKYFPDVKYGGKENALEAAKAYRDSLMSAVSESDYMLWRRNKKTERNTSGIVGVGRYLVRYRKRRKLLWQAFWQDADGKRRCKVFFVETHGEREAKALAVAAREEAMRELREELLRRGAIYEQVRT